MKNSKFLKVIDTKNKLTFMKIIIVVGARPNFIKIAPLFEEFRKIKKIKIVLVHTGQHYNLEMSKFFFQDLNIPIPNYNLGIGSGSHAWQTAAIMQKIEPVILKEKPDLIMIVGDVNSALAGALVAVKLHIALAHIEAGTRHYDKDMPEEVNRVLVDHVSDIFFCPTKKSVICLKKEGLTKEVYNVGDLMYDAFLRHSKIAQKKSRILSKLKLKPKSYILFTLHRPANVNNHEKLKEIIEALEKSSDRIIFPVHPRTKVELKKFKKIKLNNIILTKPVGYLDMLILEMNAKKIVTDSGGIQKEAYWSKVPCITLLESTGWIETVKDKWNILVGNNKGKIIQAIKNFNPKGPQHKHYGDGKSAEKIVRILWKDYKKNQHLYKN